MPISENDVRASLFEKHFTADNSGQGSDDFFSADLRTFRTYLESITDAYSCQRGPDYSLAGEETYNLRFRRSLYFTSDLGKGSKLSEEDIQSIRPAFGLEPRFLPALIGRTLKLDVSRGARVIF